MSIDDLKGLNIGSLKIKALPDDVLLGEIMKPYNLRPLNPPMIVIGAGICEKNVLAAYELIRMASGIRTLLIVEDTPGFFSESLDVKLVRTVGDEMDLMLNGMYTQTDESYRKDFVEEKQRASWLHARLGRPSKTYNIPRKAK